MSDYGMNVKGLYTGCKETVNRETGAVSYRYGVSDGEGGQWAIKSDIDIRSGTMFGDEVCFSISRVSVFQGSVYFSGDPVPVKL